MSHALEFHRRTLTAGTPKELRDAIRNGHLAHLPFSKESMTDIATRHAKGFLKSEFTRYRREAGGDPANWEKYFLEMAARVGVPFEAPEWHEDANCV